MTVEQVAREFIASMADAAKARAMMTQDAMASGGVLPQAMPLVDSMQFMSGLMSAFPDFNLKIDQLTVNGNDATLKVTWGGTNSGPLSLPIPGMMSIPPTGKKVSVKDAYILTVLGDKVAGMQVVSPADGGIPAALMQLGVQMPSM
jgi:predicted ester cyclase